MQNQKIIELWVEQQEMFEKTMAVLDKDKGSNVIGEIQINNIILKWLWVNTLLSFCPVSRETNSYDESEEWAYAWQSLKTTRLIAPDLQKQQTSGVDPRNNPPTINSASSPKKQ